MAYEDGPYVQVACFCEMTLEDKTGTMSIIRIVDTITTSARGPSPPEDMPAVTHNLKMVLMFKSGMAGGRSTIRVVPRDPDGSTKDPIILTVHFEGDEKGHNVVANIAYTFSHEGVYWFDVCVEDTKVTSIPIRIKYDRMVVGPMPQQPPAG